MTWYVYLIKTAIDTLYCGVTTDLQRRLIEHEKNSTRTAKYLRGKQPLTLVWQYRALNKAQAMRLEWQIKRLSKKQKEQLCETNRLPDFLLLALEGKKQANAKSTIYTV